MIVLVWTLAGVEDGLNWLYEHPLAPLVVVAALLVVWLNGRESK
jgi:hypothetical protein